MQESKDIQRTSSDEGNYTPARSPVDQDLLSNDLLDEIETLVSSMAHWGGLSVSSILMLYYYC